MFTTFACHPRARGRLSALWSRARSRGGRSNPELQGRRTCFRKYVLLSSGFELPVPPCLLWMQLHVVRYYFRAVKGICGPSHVIICGHMYTFPTIIRYMFWTHRFQTTAVDPKLCVIVNFQFLYYLRNANSQLDVPSRHRVNIARTTAEMCPGRGMLDAQKVFAEVGLIFDFFRNCESQRSIVAVISSDRGFSFGIR
jgi:hypothetical protein